MAMRACSGFCADTVERLAIELRRVVSHRKVHLQDLAEADLLGVKTDAHRFRVAGAAGSDGVVLRR
jgi:hypothetical protein